MSNKIDDGGPAFPMSCTRDGYAPNVPEGMSLRDWFAGQALAGICSANLPPLYYDLPAISNSAYQLADAMLAARKGKGET